eukprot:UN09757
MWDILPMSNTTYLISHLHILSNNLFVEHEAETFNNLQKDIIFILNCQRFT